MNIRDDIQQAPRKANGSHRSRIISYREMENFQELVDTYADDENVHTIRVYSHDGFVSNSYKSRAEISVLEARRDKETKEFSVFGFTVDAKRSYGNGSLTTINGRAG